LTYSDLKEEDAKKLPKTAGRLEADYGNIIQAAEGLPNDPAALPPMAALMARRCGWPQSTFTGRRTSVLGQRRWRRKRVLRVPGHPGSSTGERRRYNGETGCGKSHTDGNGAPEGGITRHVLSGGLL
jgi:hypothetical protein